eukprot:GHVS01009547.1.p1 GENE.GHVS01009547.1~~GHVS01009547.1.p1  ORF type:complete len:176 (-),score=40.84 GHVS01009547.1:154-681(-)
MFVAPPAPSTTTQQQHQQHQQEGSNVVPLLLSSWCAGLYNSGAVKRTTEALTSTDLDGSVTSYIEGQTSPFPVTALCITGGIHLVAAKVLSSSFKRFFFYRPALPGLIATIPALTYFSVHLANQRRSVLADLLFNEQLKESSTPQMLATLQHLQNIYSEKAPTDYRRLQKLYGCD